MAVPLSGLGDNFSKDEQEHLIQNILCKYYSNYDEITIRRPSLQNFYYLSLLLSAAKCPSNTLYIYFGNTNMKELLTEEEIEVADKFSKFLITNSSLKKLLLFTYYTEKCIKIFEGIAQNKNITDLNLCIEFVIF